MGGTDFINWAKDKFLSTRKDEKEIPQLKKLKPKIPLITIIQSICDEFGRREEEVKMRGNKYNKVRAIAMYLARDLSWVSGKELGEFFYGISGEAIV